MTDELTREEVDKLMEEYNKARGEFRYTGTAEEMPDYNPVEQPDLPPLSGGPIDDEKVIALQKSAVDVLTEILNDPGVDPTLRASIALQIAGF